MKKVYYLLYLAFFTWTIAQAQTNTGSVKGKITDAEGVPLPAVMVNIKGTTLGAVTDVNGDYFIGDVPTGEVVLVISSVGFEVQEQKVTVSEGSSVSAGPLVLKESTKDHHEVVVEGARNYKVDQVSNALRLQTPILETPQNIQVITSEVLADQQAFDMLESVTRNVSGAARLEHWDNYALIYMRGSQVTPFRNGMNVQMPWGPTAEDMSMVDRIEFVKGPAGFMMANGEPAGFYNVATKKPTGSNKGEATVTLGSFQTYRTTLDLDRKLTKDGKLSYRLNLMGQMKGSHRDYEYSNRYSIVPVLKYQINKNTSLTAEYTYQHVQSSPLGSAYVFSKNNKADLPLTSSTLEPNLAPTVTRDNSLFLILNHKLNERWSVTGQLAYFNYKQIGSSLWPSGFSGDSILLRGTTIWDALGINKQGQFFVNGDVTTGPVKHRILAGIDMFQKDYFADWSQGFPLNGTTPFNVYYPKASLPNDSVPDFDRSKDIRSRGVHYTQANAGIYVQDELRFLNERVRLTLAGRYTSAQTSDPYSGSTKDEQITPRVGLSVSVTKNTAVYALYDQAFLPQGGSDFYGNKFKPVTGENIEAGVKKDWFEGKWNTAVSVYSITKNNVLTADPNNMMFSIQLGQTRTQGVEFDLRGELTKGLNLILNYAYTESKVTKDTDETKVGTRTPGSALNIANAWLSYQLQNTFLKGFGVSVGCQYQDGRSSWSSSATDDVVLPTYVRLDGSLFWKADRMRISLNVNNILDEYLYIGSYYAWGGYYNYQIEAPRNFRASIAYNF